MAGGTAFLVLLATSLAGCPWGSDTASDGAKTVEPAAAVPVAAAVPSAADGGKAPEDEAYVPGGLAACPCSDGKKFVLTDNSNGRLLQLDLDAKFAYRTTLAQGLENPGDVDIAEEGRAFVYADGSTVVEHYFGLTAFVHDGAGAPLAGADVVVEGATETKMTRVDGTGMFTVFDLLPPPPQEPPEVTVTIAREGKSLQFPIFLDSCCQTCREILFAPEQDPKGILDVDVKPSGLPGVRWRLQGVEIWLEPEQTLAIYPGEYTLVFSEVTGFKTPEAVKVIVSADQVKSVEVEYVPL